MTPSKGQDKHDALNAAVLPRNSYPTICPADGMGCNCDEGLGDELCDPPAANRWGETRKQARNRRRAQGVLVAALTSDLYERTPTPEDDDGMTWESPLKWRVRISAPGPRVEVTDPRGEPFADYVDVDGYTLGSVLP